MEVYNIASYMTSDLLRYYIERVLSYDKQENLTEKTGTELVDLFTNEVSYQDLVNFGLVNIDMNKEELNINTHSNVYDLNFFRALDIGEKRLDVVA